MGVKIISYTGSYLADPTSPIPSHCASIVVTSTLRVNFCNLCVSSALKGLISKVKVHESMYPAAATAMAAYIKSDELLHGLIQIAHMLRCTSNETHRIHECTGTELKIMYTSQLLLPGTRISGLNVQCFCI